jgi:hypothetical protein
MPDFAPGCSPVRLTNEDASAYEAGPFRNPHTIFERVRIRSRDGTIASAMSRKRNGKSNVAPAKLPTASTNDQGDEHGCD